MIKLSLVLVGCLISFQLSADSKRFQIEPEVGDWKGSYCWLNAGQAYFLAYGNHLCSAKGGQTDVGFVCHGADYDAWDALDGIEKVRRFLFFQQRACTATAQNFTGWGTPAHDVRECRSAPTRYRYGVIEYQHGKVDITGIRKSSSSEEAACDQNYSRSATPRRHRDVECPAGSIAHTTFDDGVRTYHYCYCPADKVEIGGQCIDPDKDCRTNSSGVGNPCDPKTGVKYQAETDISASNLPFTRNYRSTFQTDIGLGIGWSHSYSKILSFNIDKDSIYLSRSTRGESFTKQNNLWVSELDSDYSLLETSNGDFKLLLAKDGYEHYNSQGQLVFKENAQGQRTSYEYIDDKLNSVTNSFGQSLSFDYKNNKLVSVMDGFGDIYRYNYDANENLIDVTYPDLTSNNHLDNPRRIYHYEDPRFPNHLTGITDENGSRLSRYAYDNQGKAISTEYAKTTNGVGQERFGLDYQ